MIEWIIGAAVLGIGALLGDDKKIKKTGPVVARSSLLARPPTIDQNSNFSEWRAEWEPTVDRTRWIPKRLASEVIQNFLPHENGTSIPKPTTEHSRFEKALRSEFEVHNANFLSNQKEKLGDFFAAVERNPLTDEQMDSCICMDDAVQIIAAAGSGKTSTIVARVGYALNENLAQPEQILILAFNRSVKEELEARIKERLRGIGNVDRINVKTFNAFGLEVIGKSTGRKPRLADWVQPGRDIQAISEIVDDLRQRDPRFRQDWDMFRTVFGRDVGGLETLNEASIEAIGKGSIQTADGNRVKSQEERMICDFLFYHGVPYEYERSYEHDTVTEEHSQYHPDFYYPRTKLYHEHFALDVAGSAPAHFSGDYVAGVQWKRILHEENETQLFETTSHGLRNGDDLDRLKLELEQRGEVLIFDETRPS